MTHLLGMHWLKYHQDRRDLEHVERMQYRSIKPFEWMWNNRDFCRDLLAVLPGEAYITARDHPLSEQKEAMWVDPVGTGIRHANEWADKVRNGQYHLPTDRTFFLGINEPDATDGDRSKIDRYNVAYLDRLREHGLRGGAFNFSTGHPRTVDGTPHTPADYSVFEGSHQAIVRGNHIAMAHIYGTAAVPLVPGHYDRLTACTWQDVEWIIGEFGVDEHVIGGGPHIGFHGGFAERLHEYCGWLDQAIAAIRAIFPYIHSFQKYTFDFSHPWGSFDVRAIREALEAYDWQHAKTPVPADNPHKLPLPYIVKPGAPTATVNVPAGANVRTGPGTNYPIIGAEPHGAVLPVVGRNVNSEWWAVDMPHASGWVSGTVVQVANVKNVPVMVSLEPAPKPTPSPTGIIDPFIALAFLQVESNNAAFQGGLLTIRFEVHRFKAHLSNDELFNRHFKFTPGDYADQWWRPSPDAEWLNAHGSQAQRHELLRFAERLNQKAAYLSIGMGTAQIMGENHARVGYSNPFAMFKAFSHPRYGINAQVMGFVNYVLSDPKLFEALRNRDWFKAVQGYNGIGQESIYVPLLEQALSEIHQAVGA